ncbi:unnamed protein product [Durusdinium trenchii]|uniref:Mitochondrial (SDH assembly factor 2) (SDHAF2) n=2 Tax=Durusdinium trenchii TaxID=1381693 RepID=A0ABP0RG32_9DINO
MWSGWGKRLPRLVRISRAVGIRAEPVTCKLSLLDAARSEVLWKSRNRDWMEMNLVLSNFVERSLHNFNDEQVELLAQLLQKSDVELYPWLSGRSPVPIEMLQNDVFVLLLGYINSHHPALKHIQPGHAT